MPERLNAGAQHAASLQDYRLARARCDVDSLWRNVTDFDFGKRTPLAMPHMIWCAA